MTDEVSVAQQTKSIYNLADASIAKYFWQAPASAKLILFHANWCGYCKDPRTAICQLSPPRQNGPTTILFGLVESAAKAPIEAMTGVTANGFPTMILFGPDNRQIHAMRSRTAPAIVAELNATVPAAMADPSMQYIRTLRFPQQQQQRLGGSAPVPCMHPVTKAVSRPTIVRPWPAALEQARSRQQSADRSVEPRFFHRPLPVPAPLFDGRIGGRGPRLVRFGGTSEIGPSGSTTTTATTATTAGGTNPTDESAVRAALIAAHGEAPARLAKPSSIPTDPTSQQLAAWRARRASRAAGARKLQMDSDAAAKKAAGAASDGGGCVVM